jgi:hypothetical protein
VKSYVSQLKRGKAADYCITSEHIQLASEEIVDVLTNVTNNILNTGKMPATMKTGIITPVPKKGKDETLPDNYRRITVSSLLGKVAEKDLLCRMKDILKKSQSPVQFGFTEGCSYLVAAFLLTESLAEARDLKQSTCVTYMDASKAFDMVDHHGMLNAVFEQGIQDALWLILNDLYTDITSCVKWCGEVSQSFMEGQGIRQGGLTSAELFKPRSTRLLRRYECHPDAFRIGCITTGALMCADDIWL